MDRRTEIRDFLTSRRARITPARAGLTLSPLAGARRVPGLRREEVALKLLASWSAEDRAPAACAAGPGQP